MPQGVTINDAEQLQQLTGDVNFPCQSPDGTGAERATAEQLRQYTADNTNVSDLQGASNYATQTDLQGKQDTLTAGANITIDADNEISATVPTKTSQLQNDSGFLTTETDPVFSDSPAAGITSQDITDWNNKSDFSGDYDDLTDKPTLGTAAAKDVPSSGNASTTEVVMGDDTRLTDARTPISHTHTVSQITDFPTIPSVAGKADKVSGATSGNFAGLDANGNLTDSGLTATSVSGAVTDRHTHSNKALLDTYSQTESNLADAVSKKHSHSNKSLLDLLPSTLGTAGQALCTNTNADGTEWKTVGGGGSATDVQINGTSITSGGVANIVTETAYNASTNKIATVADLPSVPAISTDIQTDKASTTKTASPSAVYNEVHPTTGSSQPVGGMLPNILYKLGTLSGSVTIALASPTDNTICNHYYFTFTADSTAPTITWDAAITSWNGGSAPTITASKHYEISVLDGVATFMEV